MGKRITVAAASLLFLIMCACGGVKPDISGDREVLRVGSYAVTGEEYRYWVMQSKAAYESLYGSEYWAGSEGRRLGRELLENVNDYIIQRYAILSLADEAGFRLSPEAEKALEGKYQAELSGIEDVPAYPADGYMNERLYYRVCYLDEERMNKYGTYLLTDKGDFMPTGEELAAFILEGNYASVTQIMIKNDPGDDTGSNRRLAEELRERALAGEDFQTLAQEYNESAAASLTFSLDDSGYAEYFRDAVRPLAIGGISEVAEYKDDWQSWYLLIKRTEPDKTEAAGRYTLQRAQEYVDKYIASLNVTFCEGFENIGITDIQ